MKLNYLLKITITLLTDAHARADSKWQNGKWMDFSQVIIKPTFRFELQRELKQLLWTSRKVIGIHYDSLKIKNLLLHLVYKWSKNKRLARWVTIEDRGQTTSSPWLLFYPRETLSSIFEIPVWLEIPRGQSKKSQSCFHVDTQAGSKAFSSIRKILAEGRKNRR